MRIALFIKPSRLAVIVALLSLLVGCATGTQPSPKAADPQQQTVVSAASSSASTGSTISPAQETKTDAKAENASAADRRKPVTSAAAPPSPTPTKRPIAATAPTPGPNPAPKKKPSAAPAKSPTAEISAEDNGIMLNLRDAQLHEVIAKLAEVIGINYIVHPDVTGTVTIHTTRKISNEDLVPIFFQILQINGFTAVQEGALYKIVPLPDVARLPVLKERSQLVTEKGDGHQVIIQIVPLSHLGAKEVISVIKPLLSSGGSVIPVPGVNTLLIIDTAAKLQKLTQLVDAIDVSTLGRVSSRIFSLHHIDAEQTADQLESILSVYGGDAKKQTKVIPIKRLNLLMIASAQKEIIQLMGRLLEQLDIPSESSGPRIFIYKVKNGKAADLADLLERVFTKDDKDTRDSAKKDSYKAGAPFKKVGAKAKNEETDKAEPPPPTIELSAAETGVVSGKVTITADEIHNLLIIEANLNDYRKIDNFLNEIDVMPRQVLIEVVIADITLDDTMDLGVEWNFDATQNTITDLASLVSGESGLSYTVGLTHQWLYTLNALAKQEKINILSSPSVLASDGQEARINVASQLPVISSSYRNTSDTNSSNTIQTDIDYRDTGIILSVTPNISDNGLVTMEISQEVSEQGGGVEVAGEQYPSFLERKVETTLTVSHGQTIVLGGLIRETKGETKQGIPYLSKIPLFGSIFGKHSDLIQKTELIFVITPRVILNPSDIDSVTAEFKSKIKSSPESFNMIRPLKRFSPQTEQSASVEPASENSIAK